MQFQFRKLKLKAKFSFLSNSVIYGKLDFWKIALPRFFFQKKFHADFIYLFFFAIYFFFFAQFEKSHFCIVPLFDNGDKFRETGGIPVSSSSVKYCNPSRSRFKRKFIKIRVTFEPCAEKEGMESDRSSCRGNC